MNSSETLFELKYLEEISELFNKHREISNYYNLDLFQSNYCDFYDFLKDSCYILEFYDDEEDDSFDNTQEHLFKIYDKI
jgi:hypothetical protein